MEAETEVQGGEIGSTTSLNSNSDTEPPGRKDSGRGESLEGSPNMVRESPDVTKETKYSLVKNKILKAESPTKLIQNLANIEVHTNGVNQNGHNSDGDNEESDDDDDQKEVRFNESQNSNYAHSATNGSATHNPREGLASAGAASTPASESSPRPASAQSQRSNKSVTSLKSNGAISNADSEHEINESDKLSLTSATDEDATDNGTTINKGHDDDDDDVVVTPVEDKSSRPQSASSVKSNKTTLVVEEKATNSHVVGSALPQAASYNLESSSPTSATRKSTTGSEASGRSSRSSRASSAKSNKENTEVSNSALPTESNSPKENLDSAKPSRHHSAKSGVDVASAKSSRVNSAKSSAKINSTKSSRTNSPEKKQDSEHSVGELVDSAKSSRANSAKSSAKNNSTKSSRANSPEKNTDSEHLPGGRVDSAKSSRASSADKEDLETHKTSRPFSAKSKSEKQDSEQLVRPNSAKSGGIVVSAKPSRANSPENKPDSVQLNDGPVDLEKFSGATSANAADDYLESHKSSRPTTAKFQGEKEDSEQLTRPTSAKSGGNIVSSKSSRANSAKSTGNVDSAKSPRASSAKVNGENIDLSKHVSAEYISGKSESVNNSRPSSAKSQDGHLKSQKTSRPASATSHRSNTKSEENESTNNSRRNSVKLLNTNSDSGVEKVDHNLRSSQSSRAGSAKSNKSKSESEEGFESLNHGKVSLAKLVNSRPLSSQSQDKASRHSSRPNSASKEEDSDNNFGSNHSLQSEIVNEKESRKGSGNAETLSRPASNYVNKSEVDPISNSGQSRQNSLQTDFPLLNTEDIVAGEEDINELERSLAEVKDSPIRIIFKGENSNMPDTNIDGNQEEKVNRPESAALSKAADGSKPGSAKSSRPSTGKSHKSGGQSAKSESRLSSRPGSSRAGSAKSNHSTRTVSPKSNISDSKKTSTVSSRAVSPNTKKSEEDRHSSDEEDKAQNDVQASALMNGNDEKDDDSKKHSEVPSRQSSAKSSRAGSAKTKDQSQTNTQPGFLDEESEKDSRPGTAKSNNSTKTDRKDSISSDKTSKLTSAVSIDAVDGNSIPDAADSKSTTVKSSRASSAKSKDGSGAGSRPNSAALKSKMEKDSRPGTSTIVMSRENLRKNSVSSEKSGKETRPVSSKSGNKSRRSSANSEKDSRPTSANSGKASKASSDKDSRVSSAKSGRDSRSSSGKSRNDSRASSRSGSESEASSRTASASSRNSEDEPEKDSRPGTSTSTKTKESSRSQSAKSNKSEESDKSGSSTPKAGSRSGSVESVKKSIASSTRPTSAKSGAPSSRPSSAKSSRPGTATLRPDSAKLSRPGSGSGSSRPGSARTISRRASIEVLSGVGTPRINEDATNNEEKEEESKLDIIESDGRKSADDLNKSIGKESDGGKSDSGAGGSDTSTIGKGETDAEADDQNENNAEKAVAAAAAIIPSIAAGGTVFATAAKKKGKKSVPMHLRNIRSTLSKTFHENERYNWQSSKEGDIDSGVDESTNSNESGESGRKGLVPSSPRKGARQLNALDARKMPRSKSVPKPPFSMFSPPSSSESIKKVPMNKVVLKNTPAPNLKKVKSKVSSLTNTKHKPGGGQVKIESRKLEWNAAPKTDVSNDGYVPGGGDKKVSIESRKLNWNAQSKVASMAKPGPKPMKATKKISNGNPTGGGIKDMKERVAKKRSLYQRAWAGPPPSKKGEEVKSDNSESKTDDALEDNDNENGHESKDKETDNDDENEDNNKSEKDEKTDNNDKESVKSQTSSPSHSPSAPPAELVQDIEDGDVDRESKRIDKDTVKVFVRGRPITLNIPEKYQDDYDIDAEIEAPDLNTSLEWVYGYRGKDSRSNLYSLPTGEVVYYVASVAVLYSPESQTQRHYRGHTDDIECITVHPQAPFCASGQASGNDNTEVDDAHVQIWNYETLELVHILGLGEFSNKVTCLAFSIYSHEGESKLAVVDGAEQPNISVWTNFDKKQFPPKMMTQSTASSDKVLSVKFYEKRHNILVTCGKTHLNIWSIEGDILMRRQGLFTKKIQKPKYVICVAFASSGEIISGDTEGNVMVWRSVKVVRVLKGAHTGPVADICVLDDGSFVSGGVSDGAFVVFDSKYDLIGVGASLPEQFGGVRRIIKKEFSVNDGVRKHHLYVGTTTNSIVEVLFTIKEGSTDIMDLEIDRVVLGHYQEVWGLATHPTSSKFITCGYDGNVIYWDAIAHADLWVVQLNGKARCVDLSPDGLAYAVGTLGGVLHVGKMETKEHVIQSLGEPIEDVAFSPNRDYLAVGSHDMLIHVYKFEKDEYEDHVKMSECQGHSSYIKFIDWSTNSLYIRSNSADLELLYWNPVTGDQVTDPEVISKIEWASQKCVMSFETLGIWQNSELDRTDVNSCSRSDSLIASADDTGKVRLYTNPASHINTQSKDLVGHSSHVTAVEFFDDDSKLVSVGGRETSIMQWSL